MHYTLSWTRTKTSVHAENISLMCCCRDLTGVSYKFQFVSCLSHDFLIHPLSGHLSPKGKSILSSALYKCSEKRTDILTAGKKKLKKKEKLGPSRQTKSQCWCCNMGTKCACFVFPWILLPSGLLIHVSFIISCITSYGISITAFWLLFVFEFYASEHEHWSFNLSICLHQSKCCFWRARWETVDIGKWLNCQK